MKTIIYKFATLRPVKVTENEVCITSLKDGEDMMPYDLWLKGGGIKTKLKLALVHLYCDQEDKSTEYMLQLMQDECNVSLNTCLNYLKLSEEEKTILKSQALLLSN